MHRQDKVRRTRGNRCRDTIGLLTAVVAMGACGPLAPPPVVSGPCLLEIRTDTNGGTPYVLDPPYSVRPGPLAIMVHGTGWSAVHVTLVDPSGSSMNVDYRGETINRGLTGFPMTTPGLWRLRFQDPVAGCAQEFSVAVQKR